MSVTSKPFWQIGLELIPLVTLAGALLALSYTVGYFTPFGVQWLSFLTLNDVLGLVWFLVPTSIAACVGGFLFHATAPARKPATPGQGATEQTPQARYSVLPAMSIAKNLSIGIGAVGGLSAVMILRVIDPEGYDLLGRVTMIHGFAVFFLPELYLRHPRSRTILILCFTYGAIISVYGLGILSGTTKLTEPPKSFVTLTDGAAFCTSLVGQAGAGILVFDRQTRTSQLISQDQVASIAASKSCPTSSTDTPKVPVEPS